MKFVSCSSIEISSYPIITVILSCTVQRTGRPNYFWKGNVTENLFIKILIIIIVKLYLQIRKSYSILISVRRNKFFGRKM